MRKFKITFLSFLAVAFLMTSCQKEQRDQEFDRTVTEQSEEIADTPEDLEQDRPETEQTEKQLATSGILSLEERPAPEVHPDRIDEAQSRGANWIYCGQNIAGTTHGAGNHYNGHLYKNGCLDKYYAFDAPDKKYLLSIHQTADVTIRLSGLSKDLDVFLFNANWAYEPAHCIGYSVNPHRNNESITVRLHPGVYVIVIDGYKFNQVSNFHLSVECNAEDCENFDSYANGNISSQSAKWRKWLPGAAFDAQVTNHRSYSPHKSVYIDHKAGYHKSDQMDVIRKVGEYSSGHYLLKWKIYVPHHRNAAFNFQKYSVPGLETGLVVYLRKGKGIALRLNNQIYQSTKTYKQGQWIDVFVDYDISAGFAVMSIGDKLIAAWDTRDKYNSHVSGVSRLGGVNFWAYHDYTTYYVDDFCVEDINGLIIDYYFDDETLLLGL